MCLAVCPREGWRSPVVLTWAPIPLGRARERSRNPFSHEGHHPNGVVHALGPKGLWYCDRLSRGRIPHSKCLVLLLVDGESDWKPGQKKANLAKGKGEGEGQLQQQAAVVDENSVQMLSKLKELEDEAPGKKHSP